MLDGEKSCTLLQPLSGRRMVKNLDHGIGKRRIVSNGDKWADAAMIQNFRGPGWAVRADDRTTAGQRLDQDIGEPLPARGEHEQGGATHVSKGIDDETGEIDVGGDAKGRW
jgi:hypothetical protein